MSDKYEHLITDIQNCLSDDLRKPEWRGSTNHVAGHCYVASEALHHILDCQTTPMRIRHEGVSHWYLRLPDGTYLDPTEQQFETPVPHESGVGCGFLTREPSKRTKILMERLNRRNDGDG